MTFLAMIIALVLERLSPLEDWLHRDAWFYSWLKWLASLGVSARWRLLLGVALPCAVAQFLLDQFQPLLFGLAWIAAAVLLLLYALGRGSQGAEQERYRSQCRRGDFEAALLDMSSRHGWVVQDDELDAPQIHDSVQQGFLYQGYQRWFGVLFYFLLLGPVGALAYRLLQLACGEDAVGERALLWVDWVPVRLLAATFALTGNFVASIDAMWHAWRDSAMASQEVLYSVALAATGEQPPVCEDGGIDGQRAAAQNETLSALVRRASVCWVGIISVLVILL